MSEPFVDDAFRRILNHAQSESPGGCPDANAIAAWLDHRLPAAEAEQFERHVAVCPDCGQILGMCLQADEPKRAEQIQPTAKAFAYRTSPLRLVFAAVVLLAVGALLFQATRQSGVNKPAPQIAGETFPSGISGGSGAALSAAGEPRSTAAALRSAPAAPQAVKKPAIESAAPRTDIAAAAPGATQKSKSATAQQPAANPVVAQAPPATVQSATKPEIQNIQNNAQLQNFQNMAQAQNVQNTGQTQNAQNIAQAQNTQNMAQSQTGRPAEAVQQAATPRIAANVLDKSIDESKKILAATWVRQALAEARSLVMLDAVKDNSKKVGGRLFYRTEHYWVDAEAASHQDAPAREIARGSTEYNEIVSKEKGVAELKDAQILIFWNGLNCLIGK